MGTRCIRCGTERAQVCFACESTSNAEWDPFVEGKLPHGADAKTKWAFEGYRIFVNSRYQVAMRHMGRGLFGDGFHLSIKRRDKGPCRDWRDFQRIKNELLGPQWEALEMYPAESRVIDTANQYHLWCFEKPLPFGWFEGRFVDYSTVRIDGSVQRAPPEAKVENGG